MKNFILVSILLGSMILAGCGQKNEIENPQTMTTKEIFERKQECANYKNEIEKEIGNNPEAFTSLEEIFYSPTKNTCIYIYEAHDGKRVIDYFTKKVIFGLPKYKNEKNNLEVEKFILEKQEEYDKSIKELKGE